MHDNISSIEVLMEEDGVYLKLINSSGNKDEIEKLIMDTIFKNDIDNIDAEAVDKLLNSEKSIDDIIVKISSVNYLLKKDEKVYISFSDKNLKAYITFTPDINGGKKLVSNDIVNFLKSENIMYGLNYDLINNLVNNKEYYKEYLIAEGKMPVEGKDAYITYFFDTSPKSLTPKLLENGDVDFRELSLIQTVNKNDILAKLTHAVKGEDGINVLGEKLPCMKVKDIKKLYVGKNVICVNDGTELIANTNGQIVFIDEKINILEVLIVEQDVGPATGNINFNGSILIKGNVLIDFEVIAEGNIEIQGYLEGAKLKAGGDIFISKGIIGMNKANIISDGNLTTLFVKYSNLYIKGNIYADMIMYSNIKAKGSLFIDGKNGLLVGGDIFVKKSIFANKIGSSLSVHTNIVAGISEEMLEEYNQKIIKFKELKKDYDYLTMVLKSIKKIISDSESIPKEKKSKYMGTLYKRQILENDIKNLKDDIDKLRNLIFYNKDDILSAYIKVRSKLFSDVVIQIGSAALKIREDIDGCCIRNINDKLEFFVFNEE